MRLTGGEWQVLSALWELGGTSLGALEKRLRPRTGWAKTTLLTYLTRMEGKGLVHIDKSVSPHVYRANVAREAWVAEERRDLLERVYEGSAGSLVAAFLREETITEGERSELRRLLDEMEV